MSAASWPVGVWSDPVFTAGVRLLGAAGASASPGTVGWTEPLLLGLSGGLGLRWARAGRSLELELLGAPDGSFGALRHALSVAGGGVEEHAPRGQAATVQAVETQLAHGRPVLLWTDGGLATGGLATGSLCQRPAVVVERARGGWLADTGGAALVGMSSERVLARQVVGSPLCWLNHAGGDDVDLEEDVPDVVRAMCYALLVQPARRSGLPAMRRWLEALDAGTEGWSLGEPAARAGVFLELHRRLAQDTDGQAWRLSYARFLEELSEHIDNEDILDPAATWRRAGQGWAELAELSRGLAASGALDDGAWREALAALRVGLAGIFELEMRATTDLQHMIY